MKFLQQAKTVTLALTLTLGLATSVDAQERPSKIHVMMDDNANNDDIVRRIATEFRDRVARSPRYQLSSDDPSALDVRIISVKGLAESAIAVTYVWHEKFVGSVVMLCGTNKTTLCGENLMASVDSLLSGN